MGLGYRFGLGQAVLALGGMAVVLMLIPGSPDENTPQPPRMLSTSPELQRYLDDAARVAPEAPTADEVIASLAAPLQAAEPVADDTDATETASVTEPEPVAEPETPIESTTVRTAVNMREGPSTGNPTLFVLQPDEKVAVLEREGSWARIRRTDGATGWVYSRYLGEAPAEPSSPPPARAARDTPRQAETAEPGTQLASLRLRSGPSQLSRVLLTVEPGTPLRVAERRPGWARVVMPNGVSGWIRTN